MSCLKQESRGKASFAPGDGSRGGIGEGGNGESEEPMVWVRSLPPDAVDILYIRPACMADRLFKQLIYH